MKPFMHEKEIKLIEKYLSVEKKVFEWGSGGSTLYFPKFVSNYRSIEHDKVWFDRVSAKINSNVDYHYVPNDEKKSNPTKKEQFLTYINFIDNFSDKFYDIFLIDGRARQWCAEKALNYCHKDTIVFIHDFWKRKRYHVALNWFDVVDSIKDTQQTIVALKKKG